MQRRYPLGSIAATLSLWLACMIFSLSGLAASPKAGDIVVHRGSHDGTFYQLRDEPATKDAVYAFLRPDDLKGLSSEVTLPVPTFKAPGFSPPARVD
jgi:hypothetical protein